MQKDYNMFNNGDLVNNLLPTTAQIKKYLKSANAPTQRDVRQLMSFLQRLQEVDAYLMGLVLTRKRAAQSFKYTLRLPPEFKISSTEEKQLNETKIRFRRSAMIKCIDDIIDGILFGMSGVRLVWSNSNIGTAVISAKSVDLTELDYDDTGDGLLYVDTQTNGNVVRTPLDPDLYLSVKYNPMKNRRNFIGSHMRTLMLLSFLKYHNRWNWADNNERHGVPPTFATHPAGLEPEEVNKLISMVEKLKKDSVAVFPDYVKILYENALKGDQTDSFKQFVDACNLEMAINLHGQNLTTEVQQGSRAAADVHNQVDDLIISGDCAMIESVFTQQYLRHDYLLNYGEPRNDFFEFVFLQDGQTDYESNSRIITNLYADPEVKKNLPLKKSEVYNKLGFTPPAEGDEVI